MKKNDMVDLRREKLRNLLQQEMEEYQYEIYSTNGSQYLLDKFTSFNNFNNKNRPYEYDNQNYNNNNFYNNINNEQNIDFQNKNNKNQILSNKNEQNIYMNNINNYENGNNFYQNNSDNGNFSYGNLDIDEQINNYNTHYNKLRVDEFMSKKIIQDDLLNKINQKLMKINKDIDDKAYQEHLAEQWRKNNQNP